MSNEALQTCCNVGIAVCIIFGALFSYGTTHYGKLIDNEKEAKLAMDGRLKAQIKNRKLPKKMVFTVGGLVVGSSSIDGVFTPFRVGGVEALKFRYLDGRIVVSTKFYNQDGSLVAELIDNEWKINPNTNTYWDRNYSERALEVINQSGEVVLQLYTISEGMSVQAKMFSPISRNNVLLYEDNNGSGVMLVNASSVQLNSVKIKPIFRYPSNLHFGEYTSDALMKLPK